MKTKLSSANPFFQKEPIRPILFSLLAVIIIGFIAYFPYILNLGFYFNDWHLLLVKLTGNNLIDFYKSERPFVGVFYSVFQGIVGLAPTGWHLFALGLRLVGGMVVLFLFREIWPRKYYLITSMAILSVVFPGFLEQTSALTHSTHIFVFDLTAFSILMTLLAFRETMLRKRVMYIFLSVISQVAYLFLLEYFIGMELARFVFVLILSLQNNLIYSSKVRMFQIVRILLGNLVVLLIFLFWRIFIFHGTRLTTDIGATLQGFSSDPLHRILTFILDYIKGFTNTLFSAWIVPLSLQLKNTPLKDLLINFGLGIFGVGVLFFSLYQISKIKKSQKALVTKRDSLNLIVFGIIIEIGSLFIIVFAERKIDFSSRYMMPAFLGAVMVVSGFIQLLSIKEISKLALFSIFIGSSIFTQLNNAVQFRDFWTVQKDYFWQLYWRAPMIKENTVLIFFPEGDFSNAEDEEIYVPANMIYYPIMDGVRVSAEVLNSFTLGKIERRLSEIRIYRNIEFPRDFNNSLIASFDTSDTCLHVYDSRQLEFSMDASPLLMDAARSSNIQQITLTKSVPLPSEAFFGKEPSHTWCYYFQKASIARQIGDWSQVVALGDEAAAKGFHPNDPSEWLPFLEGYINLGRQSDVNEILASIKSVPIIQFHLCNVLTDNLTGVYSSGENYKTLMSAICSK